MLTTFRLVLFFLHLDGALFLKMRIVCIPQIFKGITVIKKRYYKPDEECQRNYDCHDEVTDLMLQVHEISNDIESFRHHKDYNHAFYQKTQPFSFQRNANH